MSFFAYVGGLVEWWVVSGECWMLAGSTRLFEIGSLGGNYGCGRCVLGDWSGTECLKCLNIQILHADKSICHLADTWKFQIWDSLKLPVKVMAHLTEIMWKWLHWLVLQRGLHLWHLPSALPCVQLGCVDFAKVCLICSSSWKSLRCQVRSPAFHHMLCHHWPFFIAMYWEDFFVTSNLSGLTKLQKAHFCLSAITTAPVFGEPQNTLLGIKNLPKHPCQMLTLEELISATLFTNPIPWIFNFFLRQTPYLLVGIIFQLCGLSPF